MENIRLAIFVSGGGTNCENIIRHFQGNEHVSIPIVVSSSADAYAITRAHNLGVATTVITRKQLNEEPDRVFAATEGCDYIILAGFLPKVPEYLIERFPNRIINIHPALLPKFGGKGMWGHHVHEAVKDAGETESGITIPYVTAELDQGEHIAQYSTPLSPDDTAEDIADKVHVLEMKYFPNVIEKVIFGRK